jgi:uncharacterized protein (DUF302 family)
VIVARSQSGYAKTLGRLVAGIERRGLGVVARIDHAQAARAAGLELSGEEVLVFGDPRAGTPLMQRDPRIGVELPLRMLVWADAEGASVGYNDPRELERRYDVGSHALTLARMATLLGELAAEAAGDG